MKITVKVIENEQEILSKVFDEGVYRVGRSEFSDIVLESDSISRSHLEIRVTESTVYVTNMSGSGKVKLNGKTVEAAELEDGDTLSLGAYRLIINEGDAQPGGPQEPEHMDEPPPDAQNESPNAPPPNENMFGGFGGNEDGGNDAGENQVPNYGEAPAEAPLQEKVIDSSPLLQSEGSAALRSETVVEMKPVVAKLIFAEGPRRGEELFLEAYEVSFGRSKKADIFLDDEKLSRVHAKITRVGMGYRLIDLNSRNGTYVNGVRVLEHPLSSFDTIELGNSKIRFLIHDIISSEVNKGALERIDRTPPPPLEQTKSLQLGAEDQAAFLLDWQKGANAAEPLPADLSPTPAFKTTNTNRTKVIRIALIALVLALIAVVLLPNKSPTKDAASVAQTGLPKPPPTDVRVPPVLSKEYMELSPEMQRAVEGYYNSALRAADKEMFADAVSNLKKIHEVIPYYKQSKDLLDQYSKRLKEKQVQEASERAKKDEKQELSLYLDDGVEYLKEGDFDRAAEAFNSAIVIDPNNQTAIKGLKAAELKLRSVDQVPLERDAEKEKKKLVGELFEKAVKAFSSKAYQEAIETAEKIRQIELKGDTQYLNEAKQIIDKARLNQKDEFEPFIIQAKERYAEGDYNASRDLCEEMTKRDPAYEEAKECLLKAKKNLNRLAKEAYTHGYILESMNRLEEAKQYWNRAKNYVRPGDDYYDKVVRKLDYYQ